MTPRSGCRNISQFQHQQQFVLGLLSFGTDHSKYVTETTTISVLQRSKCCIVDTDLVERFFKEAIYCCRNVSFETQVTRSAVRSEKCIKEEENDVQKFPLVYCIPFC